jgi:hypothetical protein
MSQQYINIGANPNDGNGNPLRTAFDKVNDNFTQLFQGLQANLSVSGNITAGNIFALNNISAQGTVLAAGNIVTLGYFLGNFAGNITGNITAAGTNTQVLFNSNGSVAATAGMTYQEDGTLNSPNLFTVLGTISSQGNMVAGNLLTQGTASVGGNIASGNLITGRISASGNVTAAQFIGNGTPMTFNTSAKILYVATNGSDSNDGSINKPFLTIKAALAAAAAVGGAVSVHVAPGNYTEANPITIPSNVALMGDNLRSVTIFPLAAASDLFYVTNGCYVWGITIKNYTGKGFSFNPATPGQNVFVSPYIQNLTSSTTTGTAVYIDGNAVSSISTKAMIVGFFTIINQGGRGIHILNSGYSQLVNIYTIACDVGIKVESGGFCTLNGSDCSIGNYGLVATGTGPLQTSGNLVSEINGTFVIGNLTTGQPHVNTVMVIDGDPNFYTIDTIFTNLPSTGQATVVIQQYYTQVPAAGVGISFYTRSSIIASAHTFEYVGAGTNPATALPQYGGIPIEAHEVITADGGVVTFTSTDQKGNFKVGKGFVINQVLGTITGNDFYESLFAQMTPFILALGTSD